MCKQEKVEHTQWEQDKLELPKMIRQPTEQDIPKTDSMFNIWKERKKTSLHQGFNYTENDKTDTINFKFYSEINVDNSSLFKLFNSLIETIEGEAYVVYKTHSDEEVFYYDQKLQINEIKNRLIELEYDLTNNCSIDIGVVHNEQELIEIYIDESKFIKYWGSDEETFRKILNRQGISEFDSLKFVDQFPKIVYDLNFLEEDRMSTEELISVIKNKFN